MPEPLTTYITLWHNAIASFKADFYNATNAIYDCHLQAEAHNWEGLANSLEVAANAMYDAAAHIATGVGSIYYHMWSSMTWIDLNWPSAPTVTMASIINAMLLAKFDELQKFIGIEDAYRCALWDAPFNTDFYAALARGFKKW